MLSSAVCSARVWIKNSIFSLVHRLLLCYSWRDCSLKLSYCQRRLLLIDYNTHDFLATNRGRLFYINLNLLILIIHLQTFNWKQLPIKLFLFCEFCYDHWNLFQEIFLQFNIAISKVTQVIFLNIQSFKIYDKS